jgi:anti-anti-sigma regulatory factor
MSVKSTALAFINYKLIGEPRPKVMLIRFTNADIVDPDHARELGEQLALLVRDDLPPQVVLDFKDVRALGSTAFGEVASFARRVRGRNGQVRVCNLRDTLRLGAALIGMDAHADFADYRQWAIYQARKSARRGEEDTVDYPASWN